MIHFIAAITPNIVVFGLILARTAGMMALTPFFGSRQIPVQMRAILAVGLSLLATPFIKPPARVPEEVIEWLLIIGMEFMVGLLFGYLANIVMNAIQAAGEIADVQMGLSMVMLLNPQTRTQSTAMGRFFFQLALMALVIVGGHLMLLEGFFKSFEIVPFGGFHFASKAALDHLLTVTTEVFVIALQLSLPILVIIFIVDFGLGIMNRVSPQINVLELNFAMKPTTGGLSIFITLPALMTVLFFYVSQMNVYSDTSMKIMREEIRHERVSQPPTNP